MSKTQSLELAKNRRTIYQLGKNIELSNEEVTQLVKDAVHNSPTAFNNQTVRAVVLFGKSHDQLWNLTLDRLRSEIPNEDAFKATAQKIAGFKAGAGTVLLFRDQATVEANMKQFTLYADNFTDWSEQGLGGAQQLIWTALRENNIGANLQHYNPLIDEKVAETFDIPADWVLRGQLVFGSIEGADMGPKEVLADDVVFKTFD